MSFDLKEIKDVYDRSPFAFCVIHIIADKENKMDDFIFDYANKALSELEGLQIDKLIGSSYTAVTGGHRSVWLNLYEETAYLGKENIFSEYNPKTKRYLKVHCYQIENGYCGCLLTDVTEIKKKDDEKNRQTQSELDAERLIVECSQKLVSSNNFNESVNYALKKILQYYQSTRCYIFEFDNYNQLGKNTYEQCAVGIHSEMEDLQEVSLSSMHTWIKSFQSNKFIQILDVNALKSLPERKEEYDILKAQNINSLLAVPFVYDGELKGFLGVDDPEEHTDDLSFLKNLAHYISTETQKYKLNQSLHESQEKFSVEFD